MSNKTPLLWILRHAETGKVLCDDGRIRDWAPVESFKTYKRLGNASKRAGVLFEFVALYSGDILTCDGKVIRHDDS